MTNDGRASKNHRACSGGCGELADECTCRHPSPLGSMQISVPVGCYIDGCVKVATYIVHSYPDTVRLCAGHSSLHPVEPHEVRCVGSRCAVCTEPVGGLV
jgi:hypothetical protein